MKWAYRVLGAVLVVAAAGASVEMFHPRGLQGAWRDWTAGPASAPSGNGAVPAPPDARGDAGDGSPRGPGAAAILGTADSFYDRGEFEFAANCYRTGVLLAADAGEKDRGSRGLEKALLAWGLVEGAPNVVIAEKDAEAEVAKRLQEVESAPTEAGWLALARYAEGVRLRPRLPYLAESALDAADKRQGPVRTQLFAAVLVAGHNTRGLSAAVEARGFGRPPLPSEIPPDPPPVAVAPPPPPPATGPGKPPPSSVPIPYGTFTPATKERLAEAVRLQRTGEAEYRQAGPDAKDRADHRRRALEALTKARAIYDAATAEDANSRELERRLHDVTLMIQQLKKDAPIGER